MPTNSGTRPGEDAFAKLLDWIGLAFGLGILLLVANFTIGAL